MSAEMERINYIVIGAGVNVNIRPEDFPDELKEIATSLAIIKGEPVPRLALFVEILTALEEVYFDVLLNGFEETLREWRKYAVIPELASVSSALATLCKPQSKQGKNVRKLSMHFSRGLTAPA